MRCIPGAVSSWQAACQECQECSCARRGSYGGKRDSTVQNGGAPRCLPERQAQDGRSRPYEIENRLIDGGMSLSVHCEAMLSAPAQR